MKLYDHQREVLQKMHNGCILCGTVGSGKSLTSLAYFHLLYGGGIEPEFTLMKNPADLYIITTARKRDALEWEGELLNFRMSTNEKHDIYDGHKVVIDSWNNIKKYTNVSNAFFIFDEQRVVGFGTWTNSFLKITEKNSWILLSATPGDTYMDYGPVFIANGFYKNKTDFCRSHVVYKPFMNYPVIDRYINTIRLDRLKSRILVEMSYKTEVQKHYEWIFTEYDRELYKHINKIRQNPFNDFEPISNASEYCQVMRKISNIDISKQDELLRIVNEKKRVIVFYNYDYELDILKNLTYMSGKDICETAEWNGHKHQEIPDSKCWVYFVQYNSGAEGWNCIKTDTIVFFSANYSYKMMTQAAGRIDRINTPFKDLWYYIFISRSPIDLQIKKTLNVKKKFNETNFYRKEIDINGC